MSFLTTILGRITFGLPFVLFGLMHFAFGPNMAGLVPSWLPGGVLWVYGTGIALVAGGSAIIVNKQTTYAGLGLAGLMATFVLFVHVPGMANPETQQMATSGLLKDLGLLGGALLIAGGGRAKKA